MGFLSKAGDVIATCDWGTPATSILSSDKTIEIWPQDVGHVEGLMDKHGITTRRWNKTGGMWCFDVSADDFDRAVRILGR